MLIKVIQTEETYSIRQQALYPNDDASKIILADDAEGIHLGLFVQESCVSVLSLFEKPNGIQLRKFGTLPELQGNGYGTKLLLHALENSNGRVYLNARVDKMDFYRKFGFLETEEAFTRNDIDYYVMEKLNK